MTTPPRTKNSPATTAALALSGALAIAGLSGCGMTFPPAAPAFVPAGLAMAPSGIDASSETTPMAIKRVGPRMTVRNDSSATVAVRLWVGEVDSREAMGLSDVRTARDLALLLEPGTKAVRRHNRTGWATAMHDAVVWAQVSTVGGDGSSTWYQFDRPGPYELRLIDGATGIEVDAESSSALGPLPAGPRIVGRDGVHPIWGSPEAG